MGCDIHAWIEGKGKDGKWFVANPRYVDYGNPTKIRPVEEYDIRRNSALFAALANVSNDYDIPFIQENRGLPNNLASETRMEAEEWKSDGEGHSYGYVFPEELEIYATTYKNSENEILKRGAEAVKDLYYKLWDLSHEITDDTGINQLSINDIRLVFWFDN